MPLRLLAREVVAAVVEGVERGPKASTLAVKLPLAVACTVAISQGIVGALVVETVVLALGLLGLGARWARAVAVLALLPSAWLALTSLAMGWTGLGPKVSPYQALGIGLRSHALALAIAYTVATLSPLELHNILARIAPRYAPLPLLAYRLTTHTLKSFQEALEATSLRGAKLWERIAPAIAVTLEEAQGVVEANTWRIKLLEARRLPRRLDKRWVLAESAALALTLLMPTLFTLFS